MYVLTVEVVAAIEHPIHGVDDTAQFTEVELVCGGGRWGERVH